MGEGAGGLALQRPQSVCVLGGGPVEAGAMAGSGPGGGTPGTRSLEDGWAEESPDTGGGREIQVRGRARPYKTHPEFLLDICKGKGRSDDGA